MGGSLRIVIKKNPLGNWDPSLGDHHLNVEIEPDEWEELFFDLVGAGSSQVQAVETSEINNDTENRKDSDFRRREYPLLARISDIYRDVVYLPPEISSLHSECLRAQKNTEQAGALSALRKLLVASEKALASGAGLRLLSD